MKRLNLLIVLVLLSSGYAFAQEESQPEGSAPAASDLEKKIQNPIASMISVPLQNNTNFGIGPDNRTSNTLNIQPVIPVSLSKDLNLITRTIVPIVSQPTFPGESEFGLGDVNLSLFLTPANPGKLIYGGGVALGLPTGTSEYLGSEKWSAGPSIILLVQPTGWTLGTLIQNTWSYAGAEDRGDVNFFYAQVFAVKNLPKKWYVNTAPIITANWEAASDQQWTVPLGAGVGNLFRLGKLPINAQAGYYANVVRPDNGPKTQLRVQFTFLFPQ